jgi:hypothetical protein
VRKRSDEKGRTRNAFADGRRMPSRKRPRRKRRFTRDQGLLVKDEDIHNFVGHLKWRQLNEAAARFDEIASIIFEDLHTDPADPGNGSIKRGINRLTPSTGPRVRLGGGFGRRLGGRGVDDGRANACRE